MDALLKAFEKRGYSIETSIPRSTSVSCVIINEEEIRFSLHEKIKRQAYEPSKAEIEKDSYYPNWKYTPTGRLTLKINEWGYESIRKNWTEGKKIRIEDILNNFMISIKQINDIKVQNTIERKEEEKLRQERLLEWQKAEELREIEEKKINRLEEQAISWDKSQQLHSYITAVESIVQQKQLSESQIEKFNEWIIWAKEHADKLNPLKNSLPFESEF